MAFTETRPCDYGNSELLLALYSQGMQNGIAQIWLIWSVSEKPTCPQVMHPYVYMESLWSFAVVMRPCVVAVA